MQRTLFMSISAGVNWENALGPLKTISLVWVSWFKVMTRCGFVRVGVGVGGTTG